MEFHVFAPRSLLACNLRFECVLIPSRFIHTSSKMNNTLQRSIQTQEPLTFLYSSATIIIICAHDFISPSIETLLIQINTFYAAVEHSHRMQSAFESYLTEKCFPSENLFKMEIVCWHLNFSHTAKQLVMPMKNNIKSKIKHFLCIFYTKLFHVKLYIR